MKRKENSIFKKMLLVGTIIIISGLILSCTKETLRETSNLKIEDLVINPNFDFNSTETYNFTIHVNDNQGSPMSGIPIKFYAPRDPLFPRQDSLLLFAGFSNKDGVFQTSLVIPSYYENILIRPDYLGLLDEVEIPLSQSSISYTFGGLITDIQNSMAFKSAAAGKFIFMGGWNNQGAPDYLTPDRFIANQDLLAKLNFTFPQGVDLSVNNSSFLNQQNANLVITEVSDVWVSCISEGASYGNSIGYYTYTADAIPQTASNITNLDIIFPNATIQGGKLHSGDKVYLGKFPAGTIIGWFVVSDGWQKKTVSETQPIYFSDPNFNPETSTSKRKHFVSVFDETIKFFGIGFEELNRESANCDNDFNDLVFNAIVVPYSSVNTSDVNHLLSSADSDGDGVINTLDQYPNDILRAYNNYYPSSGTLGSLVFEDLWPAKGDYDFNDLVVGYQYNIVTNSNNQAVDINSKILVRAIGASFHNGFGISLNLPPSAVSSVAGNSLKNGYISVASNGTESGQDKATIILFDDAFDLLPRPGVGTGVNTEQGAPYITPDTLKVTIHFTSPVNIATLGVPPYNPFIIRNMERKHEIHLPDQPPTNLADLSLFNTMQDSSDPSSGRYYKTANNLPWALDIPATFQYPFEKSSIIRAYLKFGDWAQSDGALFPDWYMDIAGYRDQLFIYAKP